MRYSFFTLYIFLNLVYIASITPSYKIIIIYYLLLVAGPFILNILTPYLGIIYTILNLNKFYQETVLKTQRLLIQPSQN